MIRKFLSQDLVVCLCESLMGFTDLTILNATALLLLSVMVWLEHPTIMCEKYSAKCIIVFWTLLFSRSSWQTLATTVAVLQAGTKHGFFPVYFPMSNKCLLTVKCRGAVTKYIPQSSSIKELLAIKGKKDREETGERLQVIISVIIWNLLDVLQAGVAPVLVDANCYHYG